MSWMKALIVALTVLCLQTTPALAVEPDEILKNEELEMRARDLGRELRCVVCQSQSIEDSDAPLAKDLRLVVRERLVAGDTDEEVMAYVTARYGDYVRLKPAFRGGTFLLWFAPFIVLGGAGAFAFFYFRRMKDDDEEIEEESF